MKLSLAKRSFFVCAIMLVTLITAVAQDYSTVHPSPNIGWTLSNVKQEHELYTGASKLTIPIYAARVGKLTLPVYLSYLTRSVAVDQLPSWVGSGWDLVIGGQVSRIVNGKPDEMRDTKSYSITVIAGGSSSTSTTNILTDVDFGYISNNNRLNTNSWSDLSYMQNTLGGLPFVEVCNNETTAYYDYPPYVSQYYTPTFDYRYSYDFEPDEFMFTIGNITGKFYLNHENKWICETEYGNFTVDPPSIATEVVKGNRKIPRMIYRFTITGPDGTRYIFGANGNNFLDNVEFWRGPNGTQEGGIINAFDIYGPQYLPICPNAWYLTRIETPEKEYVDFEYKKGDYQVTWSDAPWGYGNATSLSRHQPGSIHQSLDEPWYLTKVKCSNGTEIEVVSANSAQLSTNQRIDNLSAYSSFLPYAEIAGTLTNATNNLQKVTDIKIKDGGEVRKLFSFEYFENLNERLKLKTFKEVPVAGGGPEVKYSFEYNTGVLPAYGSGRVDHFGYYNNKKFFTDNTTTGFTMARADFETQYYASREPDYTYAKYETLSKVYFPTGGYREYQYEPNDYSVKIGQWPFTTTAAGSNVTTGGIRIQKIVDYTAAGQIAGSTEFIYKTAINGTTSSGVFSIATPTYTQDNSGGGYEFGTRSFIPFDRAISHITYSTVFEKQANGGYAKTVFWNYDNGANDAAPVAETYTQAWEDGQTFTRNQFKRGYPKSITEYESSGTVVNNMEYHYQQEFDNYQRLVRSVRLRHNNSNNTGYKAAAIPIYYIPNLLRSKTETRSTPAGDMVSATNTSYDAYNNPQTVTTSNSKGQEVMVTYKYPYDFSSSSQSNIYTKMLNKGIRNRVIEQRKTFTKNGQQYLAEASVNDYTEVDNSILLLKNQYNFKANNAPLTSAVAGTQYNSISNSLTVDPALALTSSYNYLDNANAIQLAPFDGPKQGFIWGYNNQYLVAKVTNAENAAYFVPLAQIGAVSIPAGSYTGGSFSFTQYFTGSVTVNIGFASSPGSGAYIKVNCVLQPSGSGQSLCIATSNACGSTPQSATFTNVTPGTYTMNVSVSENTNSPGTDVYINYTGRQPGGLVEFFYQGFEQETWAATSTPYAGKRYANGDYTVPFTKPNARNYKVNYHYLQGGKWKNMIKDYTNQMVLTDGDAIDEVRVYPDDAFMSTYTYEPVTGMTSETDANGKTLFYEYDVLHRLKLVRDQDGNIIKTYEYKFRQ